MLKHNATCRPWNNSALKTEHPKAYNDNNTHQSQLYSIRASLFAYFVRMHKHNDEYFDNTNDLNNL